MKEITVIKSRMDRSSLSDQLAAKFLSENGPIVSGKALWETLGFRSAAAFRQAKAQGRLGLPVFSIPNRRGTFAYAEDVATWIKNLSKEVNAQNKEN